VESILSRSENEIGEKYITWPFVVQPRTPSCSKMVHEVSIEKTYIILVHFNHFEVVPGWCMKYGQSELTSSWYSCEPRREPDNSTVTVGRVSTARLLGMCGNHG
jgi:hypothetical protein